MTFNPFSTSEGSGRRVNRSKALPGKKVICGNDIMAAHHHSHLFRVSSQGCFGQRASAVAMSMLSLLLLACISPAYCTRHERNSASRPALLQKSIQTTAAANLLASGIETIMPAEPARTVTTPLGNIQGIACDGDYQGVTRFLGIPFAEPALGPLRFRPPVPYSKPYPAPALQANSHKSPCGTLCFDSDAVGLVKNFSSEDCLYLNIWAPLKDASRGPLPVRAYLHGGLASSCSASDPHHDGCAAAAKTGHIQVNLQSRKGAFGFLAHAATWAESNSTGNWALLDQQLALRWIQDNIASFGGDPSHVMLFGNSAGGQAVELHVVAPGSAGLFHSAIAQSPPCVVLPTLEEGYTFTKEYLPAVGCEPSEDPSAQLECLRQVPWEKHMTVADEFLAAFHLHVVACTFRDRFNTFDYIVDGTVLPFQVEDALAAGEFHKVPFMVGTTVDEELNELSQLNLTYNVTQETVNSTLQELFPGTDITPILEIYPDSLFVGDEEPAIARLTQILTDFSYNCPVRRRLLLRSLHPEAPTYLYRWGATPSCPPQWMHRRAQHTAELYFVFGLMPAALFPEGSCTFTPGEVALSNITLVAWSAMASEGAPKWANGSSWELWDSVEERTTFLDINHTAIVNTQDVEIRCEALSYLQSEVVKRKHGVEALII